MTKREVDHKLKLKCLLQNEFTRPRARHIARSVIRLWLCLGIVLLLAGCCTIFKVRRVKAGAAEIRQSLYVPADAVLLAETERSDALAYAHGCSGVLVEIAYGVNRPLEEVIEEYHQALLASGWELNPSYSPNKTDRFAFYRKGPKVNLIIRSISLP
ncbi:MAG TPA: hypothetical protein EYP49_09775 [Anaerolineae bacterium]|nr:hypothetical protein [Anaerolineae bacterium]